MPRTKKTTTGKEPANKQKGSKKCTRCHEEKKLTDFYSSNSPLFSIDKRVPLCKKCIQELCLNDDGEIDEVELNKTLRIIDKPYFKDSLASSYQQFLREHSYIEEEDVKKYGDKVLGLYFKNIMLRQDKDKSYEDSEKEGFIHHNSNTSLSEKQKIIQRYSDIQEQKSNTSSTTIVEEEIKWSDQDTKNMEYAIEVVGYDPFEDYPEENRRFLFNSLSPYLEDDDNVEDAYKLSQIIQIVDNNNQIRICNKRIANLDPVKDNEEIKTLQSIKKDLVQSNDKIAKENEISVKNRSNKDAGKSTLTYLMRDLREKDFDKAEADYYDQLRGEGTQWAISVSQKAMLDHCVFDENDKKEIYEHNLKITNELYKELDDKKEEVRQLLMKIDELTMELNKLKEEYGLS